MTSSVVMVGGLLSFYAVFIALSSLLGGWALIAMRLNHARLQVAVSFVAGLMLGMALLHFIPEAADQSRSAQRAMQWVLAGFLAMFFLQRFLPHHHHDVPEDACGEHPVFGDLDKLRSGAPQAGASFPTQAFRSGLPWVGTALGMSLHSIMGGIAVAAAAMAHPGERGQSLMGLGTALVIVLHKPFDAVAVSTVMAANGCSRLSRHLVNALFALATPLGISLFYFGASALAHMDPLFLGGALAFCAGTFLCISCADLLPELQFHAHDRIKLSLALALGLGATVLIGALG